MKRESFAHNYALTGNGTWSAIEAGFAPGSAHVEASRLLRVAKVAAVIETERARLRERSDLKAQDVIDGLRQIAEDEGAPHSARVSAWKSLGQTLGLFDERIEVEHRLNNGSMDALREFTVSELRSMASAITQQQIVEAEGRVLGEAQILD
jgi:hypothetical protein